MCQSVVHFSTIMKVKILLLLLLNIFYLTQNKIRSYLDDDDKASLQEKGHLPVKDIHHKISITFAGARFDFAS